MIRKDVCFRPIELTTRRSRLQGYLRAAAMLRLLPLMAIWPNCHHDSWEVGRNASSVFLIIDAQSLKNTKPVALKGYDVGKKKGSSVGANALQLFTEQVIKLAGQYGYLGQLFVQGVQETLDVHVTVQITKRRKPQGVSH